MKVVTKTVKFIPSSCEAFVVGFVENFVGEGIDVVDSSRNDYI